MDKEVNLTLKVDAEKAIKNTKESTASMTKLEKAHKSYVDTLSSEGKEIRSVNKSKQQLKKQQDLEAQAANSAAGSYDQLSAQYRLNVIQLNQLNTTVGEAEDDTLELVDATAELKQKMIEAKEATNDHTLKVGDYKNQTTEALKEQDFFGTSLNKLKGMFTSVTGAIGVGVAILGGLTKAYASSARGAEDLARATDRLDSIQQKIGNSLADSAGEAGVFDTVLRGLQQQLLGISSTITSDVVVALRSQQRQMGIMEKEQERQKKKQLDDAEKERQIRDDERKSLEEREAANVALGKSNDQREADTIAFQNKRLIIAKALLKFDKGNIQLQEDVKDIEFEIADAREEAQGFRSEQLINEMALQKEVNENALALQTARLEGEIQNLEDGNEKKRELELELVDITEKLQIEAAGKNVQLRKIAIQEALNAELEINKRHSDAILEAQNITNEEELRRMAEQDRAKQSLIEELALGAAETEQERELLKAEQDFEKKELELEQMILDAEERTELEALLLEQKETTLQDIRDKWNKKKKDSQDKADKIELKAQENKNKMKKAAENSIVSSLLSITKTLFGESKAAALAGLLVEKGAAIGKIFASLGVANAKAVAASPLTAGQPWVTTNSVSAGLGASTVVAEAAKGAGEIKGAKFANGGYLYGATHTGGGIDLGGGREGQNNEFIVNDRAMKNPVLGGIVESVNKIGNGEGGSLNMGVTEERVTEIASAVVGSIPVYVLEQDITEMQRTVSARESEFNG